MELFSTRRHSNCKAVKVFILKSALFCSLKLQSGQIYSITKARIKYLIRNLQKEMSLKKKQSIELEFFYFSKFSTITRRVRENFLSYSRLRKSSNFRLTKELPYFEQRGRNKPNLQIVLSFKLLTLF